MLLLAVLFLVLVREMVCLLQRGYDPMCWGIHLSVLGMGAAIINSAWVRGLISTLEPEASLTPTLDPMSLPWGDISMVLLMLGMLCYALWIVQILFHKEVPPMQDK